MPARYRVEHQEPRRTRLLAILEGVKPHFRSLDLFVSMLLRQGKRGWVRLVEERTGRVGAKRRLEPPRDYRRETRPPDHA